ncbi:phage integrase Arm DNA-binding domain-containing protein [Salmonella enterica]|uniref:Integrase lambda-type N-terminal DNA-binding domain-containing protein n=1 Tax=Salmonella enterica TaxID=28901 RepID=A0A758BGH0_SALER|nr:hypothetical protein [Salmonella bongori]EEP2431193.1 hypothetical protein [Salmonella enterica]EEQ0795723.1 hypothetical protein [Salmonella enterica subsp. enterica serovar Lattenkamp]EHG3458599.1 hypothetical protein [Salmonella enterica subsp. enterica serovar Moero]EIZ4349080.1 phage integrase Arm DNA-binding domain-containing protein [Salmonella bongori serovar 48:z81:-]
MNKIYWRYKHLVTGKSHSLGTNEEEATTAYCSGKTGSKIAIPLSRRLNAISPAPLP